MSLPSVHSNQAPSGVIVPFNWVARVLRVPVFRLALGDDLVFRIIMAISAIFSGIVSLICQRQFNFRSFDPIRAQKSLDRFIELGAKARFVTPQDGEGKIQMMTFQAQDLETRIQALGGSWKRRQVQGKEVFAIEPPQDQGEQWLSFKEKLSHFHWKEEEGVIITCDHAELVPDNADKRCFLYAHSTSNCFASAWKRAGFYIGAKQDLAYFDNGNTWKNKGRSPSEEAFYLEIEAVYSTIKDKYPVENLWVGGSCGGAPVAAHLKRLLHEKGINFFAEQSFADLDDFVKPISAFFAPRVKGSVNDLAWPAKTPRPLVSQFGTAQLWRDLPLYTGPKKGQFVLVEVDNDEDINPLAYQRYHDLARSVNTHVTHIVYTSKAAYHHADDFYNYPDSRREFLEAVFK